MNRFISIVGVAFLLFCLCLTECKKQQEHSENKKDTALNVTLYNKPLAVIQSYIKGKWKFLYKTGGLAGDTYYGANNSYMTLNEDRVVYGNDISGVFLDTTITWKRIRWGSDSSFLLLYHTNYAGRVVSEIRNDTLIFREPCDDCYDYGYKKF